MSLKVDGEEVNADISFNEFATLTKENRKRKEELGIPTSVRDPGPETESVAGEVSAATNDADADADSDTQGGGIPNMPVRNKTRIWSLSLWLGS